MKNGKLQIEYTSEDLQDFNGFLTLAEAQEINPSVAESYDHLDDSELLGDWVTVSFGERKEVYHISDFLRWGTPWSGPKPKFAESYHGYFNDTFFSVILIRLSPCGEGFLTNVYM